MDLPVVGAQLTVLDLDANRDWLFEKNRDLELAEFSMADILRDPGAFVSMAREKLDGWQGRLGIHGPYSGFLLDVDDREIRALVQTRLDQALNVCEALGACQMVVHSPYDGWDHHNLDNTAGGRESKVATVLETLGPALKRALDQGVVLVLENIKDLDPNTRAALVQAADSPALKLSVDTGHAFWAHRSCGASPVDRYISVAGDELHHVHLQDADGYADRHWPIGQGDINWASVFTALAGLRSDPHLIVEINDFDRIRESVAHLEKLGLAQ